MKQSVFFLSFVMSLLLFLPFAAAEKSTINFDMDPVYPRKLDPSFYDGKIVLLYYWTFGEGNHPDPRRVQEITTMFQNLNKLQMQLSKTDAFTVVGSYVGTDNASAMKMIQQTRPRFPVYVSLVCQADMPKADRCTFVLLDAQGQVIGSGSIKECYLTLQHAIPSAMLKKRMKSLPVQHPLESMSLVGKEIEYYSFFEPGRAWLGPYRKIETNISKNPDASGSQESIKMAIDEYLTTKLPEILEKAKAEPVANYYALDMLSRSIKGMPGEESVNEILKPLLLDKKNVLELSKNISNIKKLKETSDSLNPDQLKKRAEPLIASMKKLLNKPTLSDTVQTEGEKWMAQLEALSNGADGGPVPADGETPAEGDSSADN